MKTEFFIDLRLIRNNFFYQGYVDSVKVKYYMTTQLQPNELGFKFYFFIYFFYLSKLNKVNFKLQTNRSADFRIGHGSFFDCPTASSTQFFTQYFVFEILPFSSRKMLNINNSQKIYLFIKHIYNEICKNFKVFIKYKYYSNIG
jgi:hypothetical protein